MSKRSERGKLPRPRLRLMSSALFGRLIDPTAEQRALLPKLCPDMSAALPKGHPGGYLIARVRCVLAAPPLRSLNA